MFQLTVELQTFSQVGQAAAASGQCSVGEVLTVDVVINVIVLVQSSFVK